MPFDLVKFLSLWIYPLGTAVMLGLFGLWMVAVDRKRLGVGSLVLGLAWLWFWSMPVASDWAVGWLEDEWTFETAESYPRADAIVVLGGALNTGLGGWPYPDASDAVDRYWHAARLYKAGRAPVIILSGGRDPARPEGWTEAEAGAMFLADLGVPPGALILEEEARTTRDNVVLIDALMRQQGIDSFLLVTSALHMRRSVDTFRAYGLDPMPAPVDFTAVDNPVFTIRRILPSAEALWDSTRVIHEVVGGWWYSVQN